MKNNAHRFAFYKFSFLFWVLLIGSSLATTIYAAPGDFDNSFGTNGRNVILIPNLTPNFSLNWNTAEDIAFQPDGKILVAGSAYDTYLSFDFTVTRFNADGTRDSTFADNGVFRFDFAQSDDHGLGIALQPDGKIIIAGEAYLGVFNSEVDTAFGLIRLNPNGSRDASFGNNGVVITNFFASLDSATEVAVQPDGKIIATGYATPGGVNVGSAYDFALARYNADGSLDPTFGNGGKILTDFNNLGDRAQTSVLQRDGKIVLAGWIYTAISAQLDFGLARYNPDGSLDTSFDGDGKVVTTFGTNLNELARGIALAPDGKLVVAGDFYNPPPIPGQSGHSDVAVARYNANGSLDASFDGDGRFVYNSNLSDSNEGADDVFVQPDNKILLAGGSRLIQEGSVSHKDLLILRLNPNGGLDNTFANNGIKLTDFGIFNQPGPPNYGSGRTGDGSSASIGLQRDGKIVAATEAWYGTTPRKLAVARYQNDLTSNGERGTAFDFDGDQRADHTIFRPANRVWYRLQANSLQMSAAQFGLTTDKLTPADFDGDGKTDIAVFRDGVWYWLNSSNGTFNSYQFGVAGDVPVPADYSGDGRAELAVFRSGVWYTMNLANNQFQGLQFGISNDKPVPADFDGDGKTDLAVWRGGIWYHLRSSDNGFRVAQWGIASDTPVVGDYDGDGKADYAVFRDGIWHITGTTAGVYGLQFGIASDIPTPADYDGDGKIDAAVFRGGEWYVLRSAAGFQFTQFGQSSDKPVPAAYLSN